MIRVLVLAVVALAGASPRAGGDDRLVTAAWLKQHLKDPDVVTLQLSTVANYQKGHIPGAERIDGSTLERSDMGSGASMDMSRFPTAEELGAKLEALGISNGTHVVAVFSGDHMDGATRALLLIEYGGIAHVSLLDGGFDAWERAGLPVTTVVPTIPPGHVTAPLRSQVLVDYTYVKDHLKAPHVRIVDARDPVYYNSTTGDGGKLGMVPGHIPGARNIPYTSLTDDDGVMLPLDKITAMFRAAGVESGDTVIAYCHVGRQATAVMFGARLIGQPVRVYTGSFHDWSDRNLPVEYSKP